jgi:hypothetical protein
MVIGENMTDIEPITQIDTPITSVDNTELDKALKVETVPPDDVETPEEEDDLDSSMISKLVNLFNNFLNDFTSRMKKKEQNYKTEDGIKFYKDDFLYIPDALPSHWKLRISEGKSGNVTPAQLGRAAAALSTTGFMGNQVQLPSGEMPRMKAKLRAKYRGLGVKTEDMPDVLHKEQSGMIWKQADGSYRWFAFYSNCYRDDDFPPEIISKQSHLNFISMVEKGEVPYPELWHWHVKGSKWGQSDWLHFDEDTGFAMASGYVLPGHEKEAETMIDGGLAVSHGMFAEGFYAVERDPNDPTIIIKHVTKEISDLPQWAAANKLTTFEILKEVEEKMAIPEAKREYLKARGLSDEDINKFDNLGNLGKEIADEEKRESKEKTVEPVVEIPVPVVEAPKPAYVTKEEMVEAVGATVGEVMKQMAGIIDVLKSLNSKVEELEKKEIDLTPTVSLQAQILGRAERTIGAKEAEVRKNATLTKSGPIEFIEKDSGFKSGNEIVQKSINDILSGNILGGK